MTTSALILRIRDLFKQISEHIRSRMKLIVALFIFGIAIGIPIAHRVLTGCLDRITSSDVNIIVLTLLNSLCYKSG